MASPAPDSLPRRADRIAGGLIGLLVGDALGVPYEFRPPELIPAAHAIEFQPPQGYARAHASVPPGTYSDDGAQALCLLASLLDRGALDPEDLGRRLLAWYDSGYLAVDGQVFDVGIQTSRALSALRQGTPALEAGPAHESTNGNGSLMRVLPLALWHQGADDELVADACAQSVVTHGHVRSQLCCALYCLWARRTLDESGDPWGSAVATLREILQDDPEGLADLEQSVRPDDRAEPTGRGYVVDSLHSARWAVEAGDYTTAVKAAVALGHDTDTTAAVAGGIAGIRQGLSGIPTRWRDALRGRELYQPLLDRLIEKVGGT
ncbi:MAG: ADP-ribosylglycohydrolase family protein [Isosphaeraceae bacterium]